MKFPALFSLSMTSWFLSLGIHLAFFSSILFFGMDKPLGLSLIELDVASSQGAKGRMQGLSADDEWRKPVFRQRVVPPPPPPPVVKEPEASAGEVEMAPSEGTGTEKVLSVSKVTRLPRYKTLVKAQYPEAAKRANIEGVVILQVDIDATGAVKKVELLKGLGYGCDEVAIEALQKTTFIPAYVGEKPVPVTLPVPYRFKFDR